MRQRWKGVPLQDSTKFTNACAPAASRCRGQDLPDPGLQALFQNMRSLFVSAEPCLKVASCCRAFAAKRAFPCLSVGLPSDVHAEMPQLVARQVQANRGDLWTALQALHSIYEVGSLQGRPSCHVTSAMALQALSSCASKALPSRQCLESADSSLRSLQQANIPCLPAGMAMHTWKSACCKPC